MILQILMYYFGHTLKFINVDYYYYNFEHYYCICIFISCIVLLSVFDSLCTR